MVLDLPVRRSLASYTDCPLPSHRPSSRRPSSRGVDISPVLPNARPKQQQLARPGAAAVAGGVVFCARFDRSAFEQPTITPPARAPAHEASSALLAGRVKQYEDVAHHYLTALN
uniref:Uncharacterized protein n=1 Tax=Plectus sambesii TaxID=2011161 RepID=A0A914WJW8_9BILA